LGSPSKVVLLRNIDIDYWPRKGWGRTSKTDKARDPPTHKKNPQNLQILAAERVATHKLEKWYSIEGTITKTKYMCRAGDRCMCNSPHGGL